MQDALLNKGILFSLLANLSDDIAILLYLTHKSHTIHDSSMQFTKLMYISMQNSKSTLVLSEFFKIYYSS